mmetsp:Transcript_110772/g.236623  ORF Transcript_110772/g.236623 Transcript_110772/m.236623 type:complete len:217 (-) Transcript_110772:989-1639(-)
MSSRKSTSCLERRRRWESAASICSTRSGTTSRGPLSSISSGSSSAPMACLWPFPKTSKRRSSADEPSPSPAISMAEPSVSATSASTSAGAWLGRASGVLCNEAKADEGACVETPPSSDCSASSRSQALQACGNTEAAGSGWIASAASTVAAVWLLRGVLTLAVAVAAALCVGVSNHALGHQGKTCLIQTSGGRHVRVASRGRQSNPMVTTRRNEDG